MNFRRIYGLLLCSLSALSLNATTINLGNATSYSVLAGSTVTNTGATVLSGDLGVSPGSAITGFPPGLVNGTQHAADAYALAAQNDALTAYNSLAGFTPRLNLTGQDLGGLTLTPGVYRFDSSAQLTGALTLNLQGNLDSLFIFQIESTLTTASNSSVGTIICLISLCPSPPRYPVATGSATIRRTTLPKEWRGRRLSASRRWESRACLIRRPSVFTRCC